MCRSLSGVKCARRISNCVGEIFLIPRAHRLIKLPGAPLSTTRRKSRMGLAQFAPVLRTYEMRSSMSGGKSCPDARLMRSTVAVKSSSMQKRWIAALPSSLARQPLSLIHI